MQKTSRRLEDGPADMSRIVLPRLIGEPVDIATIRLGHRIASARIKAAPTSHGTCLVGDAQRIVHDPERRTKLAKRHILSPRFHAR